MLYLKGDIVYVRATVTKDSTTPDNGVEVAVHLPNSKSGLSVTADYSFARMEKPRIEVGMRVTHGPFSWEIIGRDGEELWLSRQKLVDGKGRVKEYASTTIANVHRRAE